MRISLGHIQTTERARVQDAANAMGSDIVRALVELVTNADDAYESDDVGAQSEPQKIAIVFEKDAKGSDTWSVSVEDAARGMTFCEMEERLLVEGAANEARSHGKRARGHLGRGAKDCAVFGSVRFASVRQNDLTVIEVERGGEIFLVQKQTRANSSLRQLWHLPHTGNGTTATVVVDVAIARLPQKHSLLIDKIRHNVQLRGILAADDRRVTLKIPTMNREEVLQSDTPNLELLCRQPVKIAGYAAPVEVSLFKRSEADTQSARERWYRGVVIRGVKAYFGVDYLGLESHAASEYLYGYVDAPEIDDLALKFDYRNPTASNSQDIIKRDRTGIDWSHPYAKALKDAVKPLLETQLDAIERSLNDKTGEIHSTELDRDFSELGRELARAVHEDTTDDDDIDLPEDPSDSPFRFVPPVIHLYAEDVAPKTVSLLLDARGDETEALVEIDHADVAMLHTAQLVLRNPSAQAPQHRSATLRLTRLNPGTAMVYAKCGRLRASLRIVVSNDSRPIKPERTELIRFSSHRYSVALKKKVNVKLIVRRELMEREGTTATLELQAVSNAKVDANVPKSVKCEQLGGSDLWIGRFQIESGTAEGRLHLTATLTGGASTSTFVDVRRPRTGIADIQIRLVPTDFGTARSQFSDTVADGRVIRIAAKHFSLAELLGDEPEYLGQNTTEARRVMAEIIAHEVARFTVAENVRKDRVPLEDAEAFYAKHRIHFDKYLKLSLAALLRGGTNVSNG